MQGLQGLTARHATWEFRNSLASGDGTHLCHLQPRRRHLVLGYEGVQHGELREEGRQRQRVARLGGGVRRRDDLLHVLDFLVQLVDRVLHGAHVELLALARELRMYPVLLPADGVGLLGGELLPTDAQLLGHAVELLARLDVALGDARLLAGEHRAQRGGVAELLLELGAEEVAVRARVGAAALLARARLAGEDVLEYLVRGRVAGAARAIPARRAVRRAVRLGLIEEVRLVVQH
mmetsp:Transcript_28465/g.91132  ORF Transcript_28465/g.91132 Transcript_28465/m.91132 type:complete len:235 (-) Transcript_28465:99-803(-)